MILKSELHSTITEVCDEHDINDSDFVDDLLDRLQGVLEVMNDDEEEDEDEEEVDGVKALRDAFGGDDD